MFKKTNIILTFILVLFIASCSSQVQEIEQQDDIDAQLKALEQQLENTDAQQTIENTNEVDAQNTNTTNDDLVNEEVLDDNLVEEDSEISKEDEQEINIDEEVIDDVDDSNDYFKTITVQETELINLTIKASDKDEDTLSYSFSEPLDENGLWQTEYADAGEYEVTISVTDGVHSNDKKILLVVEKKNVPPEINDVPKEIKIKETEIVSLSPKVLDKNKDYVEITFSKPLDENGEWQTDYESAGEYTITITADDGEAKVSETTKLYVENVNRAPEIANIEKEISINEGETLELSPVVTDPDGDEVDISISQPVGNDGVWEIGYTENGEYIVTITADDGQDITEEKITLIVNDVNMPPEIMDIVLE